MQLTDTKLFAQFCHLLWPYIEKMLSILSTPVTTKLAWTEFVRFITDFIRKSFKRLPKNISQNKKWGKKNLLCCKWQKHLRSFYSFSTLYSTIEHGFYIHLFHVYLLTLLPNSMHCFCELCWVKTNKQTNKQIRRYSERWNSYLCLVILYSSGHNCTCTFGQLMLAINWNCTFVQLMS